jgi:diguanylate cyclase
MVILSALSFMCIAALTVTRSVPVTLRLLTTASSFIACGAATISQRLPTHNCRRSWALRVLHIGTLISAMAEVVSLVGFVRYPTLRVLANYSPAVVVPLFVVGFTTFPTAQKPLGGALRGVLSGATTAFTWVFIAWEFWVHQAWSMPDSNKIQIVLSLVGEIFVFGAVMFALANSRHRDRRRLWVTFISATCWVVADQQFLLSGISGPGYGVAEIAWTLGYLFIAVSWMVPVTETPRTLKGESATKGPSTFEMLLPYILSFVVLAAALVKIVSRESANPVSQTLGASVLFLCLTSLLDVQMQSTRLQRSLRTNEARLRIRASSDPLTGLLNREQFRADTMSMMDAGELFSLLLVDLDEFKEVNDTKGHSAGDALLCEVAKRFESCVRDSDVLARLGGDEFAVAMSVRDAAEAQRLAGRMIESLRSIGDSTVSASIGIAMGPPGTASADRFEEMLSQADQAMYTAKALGKHQAILFDEALQEETIRRVTLRSEFSKAVEQNELCLVFQPIISIATNTIAGVEALLRWNHQRLGTLSPDQFLPLLMDLEATETVQAFVLEEANLARNRLAIALHDATFYVSVNLSTQVIGRPRLHYTVMSLIDQGTIKPTNLVLEIVEDHALTTDAAISQLLEFRTMGIRVAIDDFGIGYSALAYLVDLPVDIVKLDRSFLTRATVDPRRATLLSAVCKMASDLGMMVLSEGVEDLRTLQLAQSVGCTLVQGYYFSRPISEMDVIFRYGQPVSVSAAPEGN